MSTDQPESGHAVSTPRSDSHVSVTRSQSGSIRKVSRRSTPSGSEKSNDTSYKTLPKSSPLNDSFNSTISTISHMSQASRDSATKSLEKRIKTSSDVTIDTNTSAVLLGVSKKRPSESSLSQASVKSDTPSVQLAKKITEGSIIGTISVQKLSLEQRTGNYGNHQTHANQIFFRWSSIFLCKQ